MAKKQKKMRATPQQSTRPPAGEKRAPSGRLKDLPPNENLKKLPDEAYGDTEIPSRRT